MTTFKYAWFCRCANDDAQSLSSFRAILTLVIFIVVLHICLCLYCTHKSYVQLYMRYIFTTRNCVSISISVEFIISFALLILKHLFTHFHLRSSTLCICAIYLFERKRKKNYIRNSVHMVICYFCSGMFFSFLFRRQCMCVCVCDFFFLILWLFGFLTVAGRFVI